MREAKVSVHLIGMTQSALSLIYAAYQQCYKEGFVGDDWGQYVAEAQTRPGRETQARFIQAILASGHDSPIEHVSFTFAIKGVSRALTHQLVRHRIASYSQQSQRYVSNEDGDFVVPPAFKNNEQLFAFYGEVMDTISQAYSDLVNALVSFGVDRKKAQEDARFVLPNAAETRIVMTMNCRSLLNFFDLRCCNRAQWEIRRMANSMLSLVREMLPAVFYHAGAKCDRLGYCPESPRFSCGKRPTLEQVMEAANAQAGQGNTLGQRGENLIDPNNDIPRAGEHHVGVDMGERQGGTVDADGCGDDHTGPDASGG